METPDVQLFERFRAGDDSAFGELYRRYFQQVLQTVLRTGVPVRDSEDVVHDVFVDFWLRLKAQTVEPTNVAAYICTRARWCAFEYHRKALRLPSTPIEEVDPPPALAQPTAQEEIEEREIQRLFRQTLKEMSSKLSKAWVLREVEGYSYEEVASILQINLSTAKMRVMRAKEIIKKRFSDENM